MQYVCAILILLLFGLSSAIGTPVLTSLDSLKVDTKTGKISTKQIGPALTLAEMQKYKATTNANKSVFTDQKSKAANSAKTGDNKKPMTLDEWHKIKSKAINSISITSSKSDGVLSPVDANKIDKEKLLGNKSLISLTNPESTNKPPKKVTVKEKPKTLEEWHNLKKKMLGNVSIVTGNTPVSVPKSTDKGKQMQTITVNGKKVEIQSPGQVQETKSKMPGNNTDNNPMSSISVTSKNPATPSTKKQEQTITVNGKTYEVKTLVQEQKAKKQLLSKDNSAESTTSFTPISPEQMLELKNKFIQKLDVNSPARKALEQGKDNKAPNTALNNNKQAETHTLDEWREIKKKMLGNTVEPKPVLKPVDKTKIETKDNSKTLDEWHKIKSDAANLLSITTNKPVTEYGRKEVTSTPAKAVESHTLEEWREIKKSRLGNEYDAQKKSVSTSISPKEQSEIEKQLINKLDPNSPARKALEQGNSKAGNPNLNTTKSKSGTTIHIDASKQGKARTMEEWQKIREAERKKDTKGTNKSMDPILPKDAPKPTIQPNANDNVGSENSKVGPDKNVQGTYINITFPNGGQLFRPSTYYNVTWSTSYSSSYAYWVYIYWYNPYYGYYAAGGYYYGSNMGASVPTPPSGIVSSSYEPYWQLYVQNYNSSYSYYGNDFSDNYLTISSNPVWRVIWPNGGETLYNGTTYTFQWTGPTQSQVPYVYVYYSTNSGSTYNSLGLYSNTGSFSMSFGGFNYTTMRWKIVSYYDSYGDVCDGNFTITTAPSITITYPNSGPIFYPGETRRVTWSWTGSIPYVYLYYYYSGYGWVSVNSYVSNIGYYDWVIPNTPSTQCQFFVGGYNGEAYDYSDGYYQITNKWQVTYPNGGQTWYNGSTYQMTWTGPTQSQVPYCWVYYSTNGGSSFTVITTSAPNTGYYNWTPSGINSTTCRMRIENSANVDGDMSDANFTISTPPSITITYPNSGPIFYPGETRRVTWTWTGNIPYVYLYYYYAEYGWTQVNSYLANVGYYDWVIPNTPSTQCQFFVGGYNGEAYAYSSGYYQITKKWQVLYPNGGETWYSGTAYTMTWTGPTQAQAPYCYVYYSTTSGSSWTVITTSAPNIGYYNWTPSGINSTACRMRIENQVNVDGDNSDANFSILSQTITVNSPNGGEILYPGNSWYCYWSYTGTMPYVNMYYSINGGSTWTTIATYVSNVGYYYWTIPNAPSTTCRFKVEKYGDAATYDISNANFTITAKWQVTYPNGGETWYNGNTYQMSWTGPTQAQVPYCWVYYSTNGGSSFTVITTSAPNIGYYNWTPSGINSTTCRMRIENQANVDGDISDANFTITYAPSITLTYPNGGQIFYPGETRRVTWTWTGNIPTVYVYYYYSAYGYVQLATISNTGYYDWVIPNTPDTQCQMLIASTSWDAYDFGDGYFQITNKWLIVVPNGGEHWYNGGVGGTMTYTGPSQAQVPYVNIAFSQDSGATWPIVFYNMNNTGLQTFGFGGWNHTTVRMRVQDSSALNNWDISDADFSITDFPSIVVNYPNGGESFYPGNVKTINWTSYSPFITKVNIYYSINGGSSWLTIVSNLTNTGSYNWTVPNNPSTNCYVKVESYSDASIYDTSNSAFTITALWRVTYPNGGETWFNGTAYYVTWTGPTQAQVPNIYLSLSTDSGSTWCATIGPYANVSGAYGWSFGGFNYTTCRIKIYDASNSSNYDISDANFTIKDRPSITITYPNGGEIFYPGETRRVTWNYTGTVPLIDFWYYTASLGWTCLATNVTNVGYIDWVIPNTPSTQCQVFVGSPSRDAYDYSDGYFQITNRWQVTYPNGGETWYNGTTYTMTWTGPTQAQVPYCWVYVSTTSGSSWSVITTSAPNTGSYAWTPTGYDATTCRMRIENAANIDGDMSDANFRITYIPLRVTAPNGGEVYRGGYANNITWVGGSLTCTLVNLYYSTDGGSSWVAIVSGATNNGSYSWSVPNIPSTTCRVRVQNYYSSSEYDISDANFTIESFRVTYPNGGQTLYPGSTCSITWTYTGSIPYVSLYYSTNGGSTWLTIATYVSNTSSYNWTVPNTPSTTCRVKVQNYSYSSEYDQSDANFTIYSPWQVTYPNGGQVFYEGDTFTMTWTGPTQAQIPYVNILFSTNSGSTWTVLTASATNTGSYSVYCTPGVLSENCRMRVEAYNSSYGDNSDADFAIRSRPWQVTYPNGGQVFYEGDTFTMTWNGPSQTYIPYVWIYMSTNSGSSYYLIGYNVPNTHSANIYCDYEVISEYCRVRVEAYNSSNGDNSDADFAIRDSPTWHVNWPNGGETLYAGYQYNMRWSGPTQAQVPYVDLYLSKDYGSHWTYMSTYPGARNTHSFSYTPAGATSYQCLFKVENPSNNDGDVSDGVFTIIGSVSQGRENAVNIAKTMTTMKFTVGPSPFRGNLRLQLPNSGSIYSLTGKLITKLNKGEHNLDTSKWSPGIYIIQCGTELKRIVKTN